MGGGGSSYDYGFRIYNPSIAKFLSVDPLARDYPWYTPFQYAGNSPISNIDVDGLEDQLAIDGTIVSGPINMERYNNAIIQKRVESERQVMGLKPFSRRADVDQSFIGPNNSPLSFEETQRMNRKYEAPSNLNRLSSDISSTSPFVGGGSANNTIGFASTYAKASAEVPSIFFQEYMAVSIVKTFTKSVKTFGQFRRSTIGVFKNTDGIHHSTLRSQGYQLYRSNILRHNQNVKRGSEILGDFGDVLGVSDKINSGKDMMKDRPTSPDTPENKSKKENE